MMREQYEVGNVVKLKGSMVPMTVSRTFTDNNTVDCVWFDTNNELQRGSFVNETLERIFLAN